MKIVPKGGNTIKKYLISNFRLKNFFNNLEFTLNKIVLCLIYPQLGKKSKNNYRKFMKLHSNKMNRIINKSPIIIKIAQKFKLPII